MSKESEEFCSIPNSELQQCAKDLGVTSVNGLQYYAWKNRLMKLRGPTSTYAITKILHDIIFQNPLHFNEDLTKEK